MRIDENYSSDITEATRAEFVRFVKWYNGKIGHEPLIVGGWAVYAYAPEGRGSRDVDMIFPGDAAKDTTLRHYFAANGYEERKMELFGPVTYAKTLRTRSGKLVEMYIDAASAKEDITDENTKIRLNWGLAQKHANRVEIAPDAFIHIPVPELLLAYKLGALVKRERALALTPASAEYFTAKIIKDVHDIALLFSKCELDNTRLYAFLSFLEIMPRFGAKCRELVWLYAKDAGVANLLGQFNRGYYALQQVTTRFEGAYESPAEVNLDLLLELKIEFPYLLERAVEGMAVRLGLAVLPEEKFGWLKNLQRLIDKNEHLLRYTSKYRRRLERLKKDRNQNVSDLAGKLLEEISAVSPPR